ncbi:MAG TPA: biopolymer transporter ExbD [Xanthomonadales bacterium]|nr:biopolymer transporter ExbD [Xanthomonadales bacterium]
MKFARTSGTEEPEISLTSLIDVVFILIIFFVVTTRFDPRAALELKLPNASAPALVEPLPPLELLVDADGRYYLDGKEVLGQGIDALSKALTAHPGEPETTPVVLRADARSSHQAVVTALDALGRRGFVRISIATTPETGQ